MTVSRQAGFLAVLLVSSAGAFADDAAPLPQTQSEALQLESRDATPLTTFYDYRGSSREGVGKSTPGSLLRQQRAADYALPAGVRAERILYVSLDAQGKRVVSSGVVLVPGGTVPEGGWPVIAWAHGTSGVARTCAPSVMKDLYYGNGGLYALVAAGYAVVASDYRGLGTPGPHQYINKLAQANDVIYSVPAARAALPELGMRWVVDGHSQGGLAAWGVAEKEAELHDSGYLGAVAVAAATHHGWMVSHLSQTHDAAFYWVWLAYAIKARFPAFDPRTVLTPIGQAHYADITTRGCWFYGYASYLNVTVPEVLEPAIATDPWARRFFEENSVGSKPLGGPILVIASTADSAVPIDGVRDVVARACTHQLPVEFHSYDQWDHDATMEKSVPAQLSWIRARFAGLPVSHCAARPASN